LRGGETGLRNAGPISRLSAIPKTLLKIAEVYERLATCTETPAGIKADPHFCRGEAERLLNHARATTDYKERGFLISMAQEWVERAKAIDLTIKETS
jgi:hypothetical protein